MNSKGDKGLPNSYWRARDRAAKVLEEVGAIKISADKQFVTLTRDRVEKREAVPVAPISLAQHSRCAQQRTEKRN
jgi:hypothetical protein